MKDVLGCLFVGCNIVCRVRVELFIYLLYKEK